MYRLLILGMLALVSLGGCSSSAPAGQFVAEVEYQKLPGTRIAYYERGEGKPLVMLTGTGSTMSEWDPGLLRWLSKSRKLIMLDYPGIGRSGPARGRYTFRRVAGQISQFIKRRHLDRPDVLGWSMGGFVSQQLALNHPRQVGRLILAGTNPGGSRAVLGPPWVQNIDSHADSDRQALKLLYPRTRSGRKAGRQFLNRLSRAVTAGSEVPDDFRVPRRTLNRQVRAEDPWLRSNNNWLRLGEMKVRTLVTAGRVDPVTPPVNARRIAYRIPGARLKVLPGAHAFLFQSRVRFTRLVNRFLGNS
jgi:pimeloyl-ACP methyl ester carboxylesterase